MRLSRFRLRLAAGFAITFALGLGLLAAGALGYLWYESGRRLDGSLAGVAQGVLQAVDAKSREAAHSARLEAVAEVVKDWPENDDAFAIVDSRGVLLSAVDRSGVIDLALTARLSAETSDNFSVDHAGKEFRAVGTPLTIIQFRDGPAPIRIVAFRTTEGIESDTKLLGGVLAVTAPLILFVSLVVGYVLARRALRPMSELRAAIAGMAADDLTQRLPTGPSADEIGALATEFNSLLGRLDDAQQRNRRFVREAAHQIRTPLTLVLGEAGNELAGNAPTTGRTLAALARIRTAAEQMRRRVDELFLLAEAQAGERVRLDDDVELDGLVLECTDLMRARAASLGRALAIGRADHIVVRGNAHLLQEALVELIENACRHGTSDIPITVSASDGPENATIAVESAGEPFAAARHNGSQAPEGLGLPIVEWIARAHGGELRLARDGERNVASLLLRPRQRLHDVPLEPDEAK